MNELEYEALASWDNPYRTSKLRCRRTGPRTWEVSSEWARYILGTRREAAKFLRTEIGRASILGQVHVETVTPKMKAALAAPEGENV